MIEEIHYDFSRHNARAAKHLYFVQEALRCVPEEVATKYGFGKWRQDFARAVDAEWDCFHLKRGYRLTEKIAEANHARTEVFTFYKQLAKSYALHCPHAEKKEAGKQLFFIFQGMGNVTRMSYDSRTAILSHLVTQLREEPYATVLTQLGLDDAPGDLEAANQAFQRVYRERTREERLHAEMPEMSLFRAASDRAFNEMAKTINALYVANELVGQNTEKREALRSVILNLEDQLLAVRRTIGRNRSEAEEEEEPSAPLDA